jgi:uncharacterized protein (TIGR00369 family)
MSDFQPQDPGYEAVVRESFARQEFMATVGAQLIRVLPGEVEIQFGYRDDLTQQHGFIHAGATVGVLDSACGYAALTLMPAGSAVLTVEFKVNLLAPAKGEAFIARGRVARAGRTLTVCSGEVLALADGIEKPIVTMLATMMCLRGRTELVG